MLKQIASTLPEEEYYQYVASLYADRKTMIIGTISALAAAFLTLFKTADPLILIFVVLFLLVGVFRYISMYYFATQRGASDLNKIAEKWEKIAIFGGVAMAFTLGSWAFYVTTFTNDSFATLVVVSTCLAHMVGVAARNFATDILVTSQSAAVGIPVVAGVMLQHDFWSIFLGFLFIPFFASARFLAASIRALFIQATQTSIKIKYMAKHDILTGLLNRTSFHELAKANHILQTDPCIIAIFDIDNFKIVNDTNGHLVGDHLLIELSDRLKTAFCDDSVVARFGGDEFVIYVACSGAPSEQQKLYNKIQDCFRENFYVFQNAIKTNCTIGMAVSDSGKLDLEQLLMKADLALYEAKLDCKGTYKVFDSEMNDKFLRREQLKRDIINAVERDEFSLLFQPIVKFPQNHVSCCEALLRWQHPQYGSISPNEFIPMAENLRCISKLTKFVLTKSILQCTIWPEHVGISVNLSAIDLQSGDILQNVEDMLNLHNLSPSRLTLEITESAILADPIKATKALFALRAKGVKIALDDFGTGYANFSYLVDIPFDKLKIDRSVTLRIMEETRSRILVTSLAEMAKNLNMNVTVEGVETQEQLEAVLACNNIDEIQGWVFGYPLPAEAISELLNRNSTGQMKIITADRTGTND